MSYEFKFLSENNREEFVNFILKSKSEILSKTMNAKTFGLLMKYLDIKDDASFIIKQDGKQTGLFLGSFRGKTAYISNMFVANEFRNKGYGTIMLQKAVILFKERNCNTIKLEVLKENREAIGLYLKEGFAISNEIFQYQNNKNSFYTKFTEGLSIEKSDGFLFQPLFRTFRKEPVPWIRDIRSLIALIEDGYVSLDLLKKENPMSHPVHGVVGYMVSNRNSGTLKIYDLSISEDNHKHLDGYLTLIRNTEKIVQVCSLYKNDALVKAVEKAGFFSNIAQYEMMKKI